MTTEEAIEGEGKKPTLQGEHQPSVAEGTNGSCSAGVWRRTEAHMRWDAARVAEEGKASENPRQDMLGCGADGREARSTQSWGLGACERRAGRQEAAGRAMLVILRGSLQINFRNFYFKTDSPLPRLHTNKYTRLRHVEILQTHLFKKIDSIFLSARSVIFFQLCQQKP